MVLVEVLDMNRKGRRNKCTAFVFLVFSRHWAAEDGGAGRGFAALLTDAGTV